MIEILKYSKDFDLSRTGHLADELAMGPGGHQLATIVPANTEKRIGEAIQVAFID